MYETRFHVRMEGFPPLRGKEIWLQLSHSQEDIGNILPLQRTWPSPTFSDKILSLLKGSHKSGIFLLGNPYNEFIFASAGTCDTGNAGLLSGLFVPYRIMHVSVHAQGSLKLH